MKTLEQITDHRGNSFTPNRDQDLLHRSGWRLRRREKRGCVWIIRWEDPDGYGIFNQETALAMQRNRDKESA